MKSKPTLIGLYIFSIFLIIGNGYTFDDVFWNGIIGFISSYTLYVFLSVDPIEYFEEYRHIYEDYSVSYSKEEIQQFAKDSMILLAKRHPKLFIYNLALKYLFWAVKAVSIGLIVLGLVNKITS